MATSQEMQNMLNEVQNLVAEVHQGTQVLSRIVSRVGQRTNEPNPLQASDALDYSAIRELLGRQIGEESQFITVSRKGNTLSLFDVPNSATQVAVFTGPGAPAETQPLVAVAATSSTPAHHSATLNKVPRKTVITRTEVRRADDVPVRLGPRLEAG